MIIIRRCFEKVTRYLIFTNLAPSAPPQNFTAIGGQNISLTWIPPPYVDRNGILVDYLIEYFGIERDTHTKNITIPSSQQYSVISGLDEYTTYQLRIRASTLIGSGPFTQFTNVTTRAARK